MQLEHMRLALASRQQQALHRAESVTEPLAGGRLRARRDGVARDYLNFSGNDYLGLAGEMSLRQIYADAALCFGSAATGSPLVTGFHPVHQALCDELCDWLDVDDVLLLSSGFAANHAMMHTLVADDDLLLLDKLCHASMVEAALQKPHFQRFLHNDIGSLANKLAKSKQPTVIATEGVFSMDGDSADLVAIKAVANDSALLLDDAHGIGVVGEQGRGTLAAQGLHSRDVQCLMANFGKAIAAQGGFLAGNATVIDYIRQHARHYIYSTALAPAMCVLVRATIQQLRQQQWRRYKLAENIDYFRQQAALHQLPMTASTSAIQPILLHNASQALRVSEQLKSHGIWLSAIRPPTVPTARLRVTLSSAHQKEDILHLVQSIQTTLAEVIA